MCMKRTERLLADVDYFGAADRLTVDILLGSYFHL